MTVDMKLDLVNGDYSFCIISRPYRRNILGQHKDQIRVPKRKDNGNPLMAASFHIFVCDPLVIYMFNLKSCESISRIDSW